MSGYVSQDSTLRQLFSAGWGSRSPIAWPNAAFDPKKDAINTLTKQSVAWVRFTVVSGRSALAEFGVGGKHRHPGAVIIQIFVPKDSGTAASDQLVDAAAAIFRSVTSGGIRLGTPYRTNVGEDGQWYQVNVTCEFTRDESFP